MQKIQLPLNRPFNLKLFFVLWIGVAFGLICLIPYALTLQSSQLTSVELPMSLELIILIQIVSNSLIFGLITGLGLLIAGKMGLGLPFIETIMQKQKMPEAFKQVFILAITIGIISAFIIMGLDWSIFNLDSHLAGLNIELPENITPPPWQGFLASFYGGITEEVLFRLFLMTLFLWIGRFVSKDRQGRSTLNNFWISNILVAVIFGLGHLPATIGAGIPLDSFVILRAIVLNGVAGVAFGWLYWSFGLESAMIAHFMTDIMLHVIF